MTSIRGQSSKPTLRLGGDVGWVFGSVLCRCSRRVASPNERIDLGGGSDLMRVLISLAAAHLALSFRFNVCSAAKRGTQTLQRLIRVPQLARDGIVVLADLR
jgi:hypothetical protein